MTPDQLLQPRYLCTSPTDNHYPYSPFKVEDIIELNQISGNGSNCCTINGVVYSDTALNKYPHLFLRLEWWEMRNRIEMPNFLKDKDGEVWRVYEYPSSGSFVLLHKNFKDYDFPYGSHSLYELLPATSEEYEQFINRPSGK